jgi:hypothetical protein
MRLLDRDLAVEARTLFEHVGAERGLASFSMLGRGLPARRHIGKSLGMLARVSHTHFRGDLDAWLRIDQRVADTIALRVRREQPHYRLGALTGIDKASHAEGAEGPRTLSAMRVVDQLVGQLRADAEQRGRWEQTQLWITSDHGHGRVDHHDDLADWVAEQGHTVLTHPKLFVRGATVAVMVSGNAMAHCYLELHHRTRPWWPTLSDRWQPLVEALLARPSVDLLFLAIDAAHTLVRSSTRGDAIVAKERGRWHYRPQTGDPLQLGEELSDLGHPLSGQPGADRRSHRRPALGRHHRLRHTGIRLPRSLRTDPPSVHTWCAASGAHAGALDHEPRAAADSTSHHRHHAQFTRRAGIADFGWPRWDARELAWWWRHRRTDLLAK